MLKVIEVANLLGVSKVTIYKKIEKMKKEMKPYIHKKRNITYIDEDGIELIRNSLIENNVILRNESNEEKIEELQNIIDSRGKKITWFNENLISVSRDDLLNLRFVLDILNAQLKIKEEEIIRKEKIIKGFQDINRLNKERIKVIEDIIENSPL